MKLSIWTLQLLFSAATFGIFTLAGVLLVSLHQLESGGDWAVPARPANIKVLASDGSLISNRGETGGEVVRLVDLPTHVPAAFVAIEDRRFYSHVGIDPVGIVSAAISNWSAGSIERGGSTITQQLAKNLFLSPERTFARKLREALLALWLEGRYSKSEILELYLNRIYFGGGAYGIEAAAQNYFGKAAAALDLGEAALLAGLVKAPSQLNPKINPKGAAERASLVLAAMAEDVQVSSIIPQKLPTEGAASSAGYIADWVETLIAAYIGRPETDIVVHTSIEPRLQGFAEKAIEEGLRTGGDERNFTQGALVAMSNDGRVRALVGGADYRKSQFNRAVTARRQPGSTFKAFVYVAALEKGYSTQTIAEDAPFSFEGWSPRNASRRFAGLVTLEQAFVHSLNTVAARLAIDVTPEKVAEVALRLGFSGPIQAVPSIALGTSEVSLLELTGAYAPFSNGGMGVIPSIIERIETSAGEVIFQRQGGGPGVVISNEVANSMDGLLRATWRSNAARPAELNGFPAAGKTGTSQAGRDALFVGYAGPLIASVWLGNDDDSGTSLSGGNIPLDVWHDFMHQATR